MICLIRNLTTISPPPNGYDQRPQNTETSPGADLARIKYYRNYLAHHDSDEIDSTYFNTAWTDISDVCNLKLQYKERQNTFSQAEIKYG